jgi:cell surface protein SprA
VIAEQSNSRVHRGSSAAGVVVFLLAWVLISLGLSRGKSHVDKSDLTGTPATAGRYTSSSSAFLLEHETAALDTLPTRSARLERLHRAAAAQARDTAGQMVRDSLGRLVRASPALPVDSTARIKQFTYRRTDQPQVSLFQPRIHPLFLRPNSTVYRREVNLDSTGTMVIIRETVAGKDVKIPLVVPLSDYIRLSFAAAEQSGFEELAHRYKAREKKDELTELLGSVTNIDIPIPPNPILSLFGGRGINLRISGAVDIRAGFRNQQTQQSTISALGNVRNEPDFNQDVQINVNGTIGDKLNINADWNTQRTFEYENQLKIKYSGYDDEIVQSVEAGNVSLATPSSFVGSSQALFGFKAAFQMGPLKLTTLASQKKGQIKEVSLSGGAQDQSFELRAYQYSTSHFFLDTVYIPLFSEYYDHAVPRIRTDLRVVDIEVWVTYLGAVVPPEARSAVAYINLYPRPQLGYPDSLRNLIESKSGYIEQGQFIKLRKDDQYTLHAETGYITLNTNVQPEQAIAVAYHIENGAGADDDIIYGDFTNVVGDTSSRLVLKLVKPMNVETNPQWKPAWNLMLKNIYSIGGRDLKKEKFTLNIYYQPPGAALQDNIEQVNLLQLLRLDKTDESGTGLPDNKFDFSPGLTIDPTRGEIIFPLLEPFREGIIRGFSDHNISVQPDSFVYGDVYDTTITGARNNNTKDRFVIKGTYSAGTTSKYSLGFNVVDGSVEVYLNNRRLVANTDYMMDYSTGQLIIRNDEALLPGANVQVKYEQNDLFALASKTLLGARGDLQFNPKTNLGFTIMNLNQQTLSDKVRLDEEPTSNTILGIDGSTSFDADILTKAVDLLPLISTRSPSNVTLRGEAAYMLPDPNTSKSPIPIDNQRGVAYVDDFEGIKRTIPLGTSYQIWRYGSVPRYLPGLDPDPEHPTPDTTKVYSKAKTIWYNIVPSRVKVTDVWPNKTVAQGSDQQTVLDIEFYPKERGVYNYSPDLQSTLRANPKNNWGGIMRLLSATANNLIDENVNFIEIWAKVIGNVGAGKMMIDLGQISEDVIPNGKLDSEDGINPAYPVRNNILNDGEDVGLDGLTDDQERQKYAAAIAADPSMAADPSGDDYSYASGSGDFSHVNGTEGNGNSEIGRLPDTEDLNNNGVVDLINNYFEYEVNLDTTGGPSRNPLIVGGGNEGWYQFRIPLINYTRRVGDPNFSVVQYIRVWFTGCDQPVGIRIADFNLVGNNWQEQRKNDSTFSVTTVSVEDNPDYNSPPGVVRARDRTRPDQNILANEQSLALNFYNLADGESRQAFRFFSYRPLDVFNYRAMKMFVRGDPHLQYADTSNYDVELFLRFGIDTLNYYEYREPVHPGDPRDPVTSGWDPVNNIQIQFSEITSVKQARDSATAGPIRYPARSGPPGSTYSVLGNPSLTQIRFIAIGLENPRGKGTPFPISGQILVDELRLTDVDDEPGVAYRADAAIKIADLATVGANLSKTDPTFHGLDARFGSRNTGVSWGVNASVALERFLPDSWVGTSLPFSYSHVEAINKPKYLPGTDVLVAEAAKRAGELAASRGASPEAARSTSDSVLIASQTLRVSETWAIPTARIGLPSDKWYVRDTFNKLSLGFNYNTASERNPSSWFIQSWAWTARLSYALTFSPDNYFSPFQSLFGSLPVLKDYKDLKFFFTPTSFSWAVGAQRSQARERMRTQQSEKPMVRNFLSDRSVAMTWKVTEGGLFNLGVDYGLDISSSLVHLETDTSGVQRPFSQILHDIFFSSRLINFGNDYGYSQRFSLSPRVQLPSILSINRYVDITTSYRSDYRWSNNLQQAALGLGRSATVTAQFNLGMNLRLKQLTDPWFAPRDSVPPSSAVQTGRAEAERRRREAVESGSRERSQQQREEGEVQKEQPVEKQVEEPAADTTRKVIEPKEQAQPTEQKAGLPSIGDILRIIIKTPFLDYDNINVNFRQQNSNQNTGLIGRTGFDNFWGRVPFFQKSLPENGPSRLYQLGLVSDPSGEIRNFGFRSRFPFFGADVVRGLRARGGNLVDNFSQSNNLDFKTSRQIVEGLRIDLSWKVGWSYNRNSTLISDSTTGAVTVQSVVTTGDIERSYFTFPQILSLKIFKNDISEVARRFQALLRDQTDRRPDQEKLAEAFEDGFETLPFLKTVFGRFVPRANWSLRWDGLEKLPYLRDFASRVSLENGYTSTFNRRWRGNLGGGQITESERMSYGFAPLAGVNMTFRDFLKGNFGASIRYSTATTYDLSTSSRNMVETYNKEISLQASFGRHGFAIPFFGLTLSNDIDISLSYTYSRNTRRTYEVGNIDAGATPFEGQSRTVMEPRIKYVLSTRVTASVFYRYTSVEPDQGASTIPGTKMNEAGLDIHISIQ